MQTNKFKVGDKVKLVRYLDDLSDADDFYRECLDQGITIQIYSVREDTTVKYPYKVDYLNLEDGSEAEHSVAEDEIELVENYVPPKRLDSWTISC